MTTTADALTVLDPSLDPVPGFDVTHLPRRLEEHLAKTTNPFHRAIMKNYIRHALLEISGYWDQILVPELTVAEPVYRITERGTTHVLTGHDEVLGFYREVAETRQNVMAARAVNIAVDDFGVVTEAVFQHMTPGVILVGQDIGLEAGQEVDPESHYRIQHNILQNFVYTRDAKLIGERVYDDPASYSYTRLAPHEVVTPELAREQLAPFLARATLD